MANTTTGVTPCHLGATEAAAENLKPHMVTTLRFNITSNQKPLMHIKLYIYPNTKAPSADILSINSGLFDIIGFL
jgi:hypothetical protein